MYVTVCPSLAPGLLLARSENGLPVTGDAWVAFRYGRDALHAGLGLLGVGRGDVALLPASMCDVVLRAFVKRGISIRYYALDPALNPDQQDLERKLCSMTKLIYANHYFGIPASLAPLRELCRRHGLSLIEDCAHTLPQEGSPVGSFGDIAIFSPRKLLPIPDGGLLKINSASPSGIESAAKAREVGALLGTAKLLAADFARRGLLPVARFKHWRGSINRYLSAQPSFAEENWQPPQQMSRVARYLAARSGIGDMAKRRRQHYESWCRWSEAQDTGTAFIPSIPPFAIPYAFPFRTGNGPALIRAAAAAGVYLEPTLSPPYRDVPGLVNTGEDFPLIERLSSQLVSLPIHQSLASDQMIRLQRIVVESCRLDR